MPMWYLGCSREQVQSVDVYTFVFLVVNLFYSGERSHTNLGSFVISQAVQASI